MQVLTDAAAGRQAAFSESPALLMQQARAAVKHVMSQMASAEQEPSLAAAKAAATALRAAHRAIAAEALLASLMLGLAESTSQVGAYVMFIWTAPPVVACWRLCCCCLWQSLNNRLGIPPSSSQ